MKALLFIGCVVLLFHGVVSEDNAGPETISDDDMDLLANLEDALNLQARDGMTGTKNAAGGGETLPGEESVQFPLTADGDDDEIVERELADLPAGNADDAEVDGDAVTADKDGALESLKRTLDSPDAKDAGDGDGNGGSVADDGEAQSLDKRRYLCARTGSCYRGYYIWGRARQRICCSGYKCQGKSHRGYRYVWRLKWYRTRSGRRFPRRYRKRITYFYYIGTCKRSRRWW